jgi:hypothetical protein
MYDLWLEESFWSRRRWNRRSSVVHKPHVLRSLTQSLSKVSLGAYRPYRVINMTCFTYLCMC